MVQPVMKNQDIPIVPSQEVLGGPKLGHVLPHDTIPYHIFPHSLQVGGQLL